jgi:uracil-DNA glycosylase family 4
MADPAEPPRDCDLCPRLVAFRAANSRQLPHGFNGAVPSFGDPAARLLVVGLAPGLMGANCSGRPFTGDAAGELLYPLLIEYGFARGAYRARPDDGVTLRETMISNAVRCVPPANKPVGEEIATCRRFLAARIAQLPRLAVLLALGRIAHDSVIACFGLRRAAFPFAHAARHELGNGTILFDSYHCSRYNLNTGRLTEAMFRDVFAAVQRELAPGG